MKESMFTTLDHLEQHIKQQKRKSPVASFFKEVRIFTLFFIVVFIVSNVVVNAQLYHNAILDIVDQVSGSVTQLQTSPANLVADTKPLHQAAPVNEEFLRKKLELEKITQSVDSMVEGTTNDFVGKDTTINNLEKDIGSYQLDFNTLPPTSRVIIPKIDVNTPLLQSSFTKDINTITKEDFDKDLYNGVVQYPTTPYPGKK